MEAGLLDAIEQARFSCAGYIQTMRASTPSRTNAMMPARMHDISCA